MTSSNFHQWKVIAFYWIIPVVTFGAGWHFAPELSNAFNPPAKSAAGIVHKKSFHVHFSGDLAEAEAALKQAHKIPGNRGGQALLNFVASLDAKTVKGLLDNMMAKPGNDQSGMDELIDRWAELDPKAALDWTKNLKDPWEKSIKLGQVLQDWTAQSPADALAALRALPAGLQAASTGGNSFTPLASTSLYSSVFGAWAQNDPAAAAAAALSLPASSSRNQSLQAIANAWAQQDPNSAVAWANSLPAGSAKDGAVSTALQHLSYQDPQAAVDFASTLPETPGLNPLLANLARNWAQQDPAAALTWADNSLTGAAHDSAVKAALMEFSFDDPAAAAAYLPQLSNSTLANNDMDISLIASTWAQQDSQAALNWALSLPASNTTTPGSPDLRQQILSSATYTWSNNDPVDAAAFVQNLSTDPNFGQLADSVARNWANTDPQAALTWAQSLPAGDTQNSTVTTVISSMAQFDPQTAFNDAQQLSGNSRDQAIGDVINAWADQQPAQAAAALASLPAGADLDAATANVAGSWLSQDPAAASAWIDTLPQGPARDSAVDAIVSNVGKNDPAAAYNWAVTIGDPTDRATQVVQLATQWSAKDPAAAAAAAQNALNLSGLTSAQQTALQKIAGQTSTP